MSEVQNTAILFTNPTNEDFEVGYGKEKIVIPSKKPMWLPGYLAIHAAKHLAFKIFYANGKGQIPVGVGAKEAVLESIAKGLKWNERGMTVELDVNPSSKNSLEAQTELLNRQMDAQSGATDEEDEAGDGEGFNVSTAKREDLEAELIRLGHDEATVKQAKNVKTLRDLFKAPAPTDEEGDGEGGDASDDEFVD